MGAFAGRRALNFATVSNVINNSSVAGFSIWLAFSKWSGVMKER